MPLYLLKFSRLSVSFIRLYSFALIDEFMDAFIPAKILSFISSFLGDFLRRETIIPLTR